MRDAWGMIKTFSCSLCAGLRQPRNWPLRNWREQLDSMQYGASASLIHVALLCGTSAYLNTSDFVPCFVHSLICSTRNF